ncbi:unnamed protein product [Cyprideis torosa]|uniref:Conserved oligomeric Golgi complex subunit 6 n=1 Tax=Cyprideis torosa TaxID=163714 RepID=A0A7R8W9R0_9CRUS|nr:unnamed protein product [Cyprideis torosa]CAG0888778.1 unnamed protein product [Cyprideis torosa]
MQTNPLNKKLSQVLELKLENDQDTLDALKELSTFFSENTHRTRRNLRSQMERRSLEINEEFLSSFRSVKESLEAIHADIKEVDENCSAMLERLRSSKKGLTGVIAQSIELNNEKNRIETLQKVSESFLNAFQLTPEETQSLKGKGDSPITLSFFSGLERAKEIHRDSQVLLKTGQQEAALDIMEQMALVQEAALERLFRWSQAQVRSLRAEPSPLLARAMKYLQERPILFKYVVDEWVSNHRQELVRAFLDVMTSSSSRVPLEAHAHDAPRYASDMLAWLHQAVPQEKEGLERLFQLCNENEVESLVLSALNSITEGVTRPLVTRIEQVILAEPGPVTLCRLSCMILFYSEALSQIMGKGSTLVSSLSDLHQLSRRTFLAALQSAAAKLAEGISVPNRGVNLGPPPAVHQASALIRDVLRAGSMLGSTKEEDSALILTSVLDPLVEALHESSVRLSPVERSVYLVNSLHQILSVLSLFEATKPRMQMVKLMSSFSALSALHNPHPETQATSDIREKSRKGSHIRGRGSWAQMESHLDILASEQSSWLLSRLGFLTFLRVKSDANQQPLVHNPSTDKNQLWALASKLNTFVAQPFDLHPSLSLLSFHSHKTKIRTKGYESLLEAYSEVRTMVLDPKNGYENPGELLPRTREELAAELTSTTSPSPQPSPSTKPMRATTSTPVQPLNSA